LQESVGACRAGLAIHPSYLSARVTLGRALLELNQIDDAAEELGTVLRSAPENLAAMRAMGEIHQRRGNLADARTQYRAALGLARNDPELEELVADLARQVEPKRASASSGEHLSQHDFLMQLAAAPAVARPAPPPVAPPPLPEPPAPAPAPA